MDCVPVLRRSLLTRFAAGGKVLADLLADEDVLDAHVRENAFGQWHACGTCRMGSADDRGAVVAPQSGRVYSLGGLRVVDASVMPVVPRANTNLTVMMIAERMADSMRNRTVANLEALLLCKDRRDTRSEFAEAAFRTTDRGEEPCGQCR